MGIPPVHAATDIPHVHCIGFEVEAVARVEQRGDVVQIPFRERFGLTAGLDAVLSEIPFKINDVDFPLHGGFESVVDVIGDLPSQFGRDLVIPAEVMPVMAKSG